MGKYDKPSIWNIEPYIAAGIDPKTGLPRKITDNYDGCAITPSDIQRQLRIIDEQDAVNRFTWYNLPDGLTSNLMERILYYKGQGMFFKMNDKFYFLPYALDGSIDVYGRYTAVTPLPFNGSTNDKDAKPLIKGLTYECLYDIQLPENFIDDDGNVMVDELERVIDHSCVLIKDYSEQISQYVLPRQRLNDPLLGVMGECIPLLRTALFNSTGVLGMRVGDESEYANAEAANRSINTAALNGKRYVPIVGQLDFQDLAGGNVAKSEEFLLTLQSLDNYRLSLYGIDNGGLFQKKSHMLEAEQEMNTGSVGLILRDSLQQRQNACNIINSVFGLGIWCEVSEVITGMDMTGDGVLGSNEDMGTNGNSSPNNNPEEGGMNNE